MYNKLISAHPVQVLKAQTRAQFYADNVDSLLPRRLIEQLLKIPVDQGVEVHEISLGGHALTIRSEEEVHPIKRKMIKGLSRKIAGLLEDSAVPLEVYFTGMRICNAIEHKYLSLCSLEWYLNHLCNEGGTFKHSLEYEQFLQNIQESWPGISTWNYERNNPGLTFLGTEEYQDLKEIIQGSLQGLPHELEERVGRKINEQAKKAVHTLRGEELLRYCRAIAGSYLATHDDTHIDELNDLLATEIDRQDGDYILTKKCSHALPLREFILLIPLEKSKLSFIFTVEAVPLAPDEAQDPACRLRISMLILQNGKEMGSNQHDLIEGIDGYSRFFPFLKGKGSARELLGLFNVYLDEYGELLSLIIKDLES